MAMPILPLPNPYPQSMAYGVPAVFFGGGLLVALRLWHFFRVGLKFQVRHPHAVHWAPGTMHHAPCRNI